MAVESRFVVIRNGVEVETFMDKKTADEYDKMLDMADSLSALFEQSSLTLSEDSIEDVSVFLAKNRENVLIALQAKKPPKAIVQEVTKEPAKPVAKPTKKAKLKDAS
jgi:dsDNA-binding SOS-regulon protein